jgi:hypothetical protein
MSSLPSSPPLLPTKLVNVKKRRYQYSESVPSSDLPVFSSDDFQDASIEQYNEPRAKRQYHGKWWESSSQETPKQIQRKTRGQFERKMDSGVFMASDEVIEEDTYPESPAFRHSSAWFGKIVEAAPRGDSDLSDAEYLAKRKIENALEENDEVINLS